jgi:transposase
LTPAIILNSSPAINSASPEGFAPMVAAFRQGLKETSYVEGQNVEIEYRWAGGRYDQVPSMGSRRGAAEQFEVSASSAIRWVQRFREDGTCVPMPRGGSTSPLAKYSRQILAVISAQRDLTLDEIVSALRRRGIPGSRSALSRFFARHAITIKKSLRAAERKRADVARARRRWIREQGFLDPAHLVFIDETAVTTNMLRLNGWSPRGERLLSDAPMGHWRP